MVLKKEIRTNRLISIYCYSFTIRKA
jgi:hypothetical protein